MSVDPINPGLALGAAWVVYFSKLHFVSSVEDSRKIVLAREGQQFIILCPIRGSVDITCFCRLLYQLFHKLQLALLRY